MEIIAEKDEWKEIKKGQGKVRNKETSKENILEMTVVARLYNEFLRIYPRN
jgi:hypothetical protein